MRERYEQLVDEFARLVHLEDPAYVRDGGAVEIAGVVFSFIHDRELDPGLVFLFTDFGPPPAAGEAKVYYELLKRNFVASTGQGPIFTVSPVTGHVACVEHWPLGEVTAALLAERMASLAEEVTDWRGTHFLSGPYALAPLTGSSSSPLPA